MSSLKNVQGNGSHLNSHHIQSTPGIYFCAKRLKDIKSSPPGEGKVKVVCVSKLYAMKVFWKVEIYLHLFSMSSIDGDEWSASWCGYLAPGVPDAR